MLYFALTVDTTGLAFAIIFFAISFIFAYLQLNRELLAARTAKSVAEAIGLREVLQAKAVADSLLPMLKKGISSDWIKAHEALIDAGSRAYAAPKIAFDATYDEMRKIAIEWLIHDGNPTGNEWDLAAVKPSSPPSLSITYSGKVKVSERYTSIYSDDDIVPGWDDPHIKEWWTKKHDKLLASAFEGNRWKWWLVDLNQIENELFSITPATKIEQWKASGPSGPGNLTFFILSRAQRLGLTKAKWKTCPLCCYRFVENSVQERLIDWIGGVEQLDFCGVCLEKILSPDAASETLSSEEILSYLRDLANAIQRVPTQGYGAGATDLHGFTMDQRQRILQILAKRPTVERVQEIFGSWLQALIQAGIFEDGTCRTSRVVQCIAKDGHLCLSLGEKTIDDLFYSLGIDHEREVPYPEGNFRADFLVNGVFIEFFGRIGEVDYDAKIKIKKKLCRKFGIKLIEVYPKDFLSLEKLKSKLLRYL